MLIDILLPVFALIATGYFCGWRKIIGAESSGALNAFVYWVALPALLFGAMARVELEAVYNPAFIAAMGGAAVATWILATLVGRIFFRLNGAEAALHGLNGAYANTGYMGIPLAISAFGNEAALPAIIAAVISVLSVALAIIPIEMARQDHAQGKANLGQVIGHSFKALIKNPMILSPCAGLAFSASGLSLPVFLGTYLDLLGAAAGPCALFAIGLHLVGKSLLEGGSEIAAMSFMKLIVNPLLTAVLILYFFPTNPLWTNVAILLAALPIGSGPFVLAQAYGIYIRPTSTAMLVTTVLSFATLSAYFIWIVSAL